jgi:hypothetical protein
VRMTGERISLSVTETVTCTVRESNPGRKIQSPTLYMTDYSCVMTIIKLRRIIMWFQSHACADIRKHISFLLLLNALFKVTLNKFHKKQK